MVRMTRNEAAQHKPATISIREAARRAGVGIRAMRSAVVSGQVASVLIGSRRRILLEALEELLRGQDRSSPKGGP